MQTKSLEDIQENLQCPDETFAIIFLWWGRLVLISLTKQLVNPLQIKPSAQSVWPVVDKKF
jgi:hypothetical protein